MTDTRVRLSTLNTSARRMLKTLENRGSLRAMYETMALIRAVETSLLDLFGKGKLRGTVHTGIGQEAIAAGVIAALDLERDVICSNHRGHGHYLAYCGDAKGLIAEVMGLSQGVCRGVGGSQHLHKRNFYSNGILGGMAPVSVGMAMAEKTAKSGAVVVQFAGDGALAEGAFYESFNIAALWKLPYLLVVEDNGYAQSTPKALEQAGRLTDRAKPFGIPVAEVDGNDAEAVYEAAEAMIERIRSGDGPGVLYCTTYRLAPHSKGDDIREKSEIADAWTREPMVRAREKLPADFCDAVDQSVATRNPRHHRSARMTAQTTAHAAPASTYLQSLNRGLHAAMEADTRVHFAGEDVLDPYGGAFKVSAGLSTRFPDRVHTTPISEGAITGLASGMALRGLKPVVEIMFGDFLTLTFDQILNHAVKFGAMYGQDVPVPMVIRTPMGGRRGYGPTHSQSIEKHFCGIAGLKIISPSHVHAPGDLLGHAIASETQPVLFIEYKALYPLPLFTGSDSLTVEPSADPLRHAHRPQFRKRRTRCRADRLWRCRTLDARGGRTVGGRRDQRLCRAARRHLAARYRAHRPRSRPRARAIVVEEGTAGFDWGAEVAARLHENAVRQAGPSRTPPGLQAGDHPHIQGRRGRIAYRRR